MDDKAIVAKLNWFYSLELNQVDLYTAQARAVDDIYLAKTFTRIAMIERQHVENLAGEIRRWGGKPTSMGEVVSPLLGKAAGTFSGLLGPRGMLKMNIALEERAMQDYKNMIMHAGNDRRLFDVLWSNLIDEDLHTAWFANKLKELENLVK